MTHPASGAELAHEFGLKKVGGRPPLRHYMVQIWERRHFAVSLARAKAYSANQGGYLGQAWVVLTPVMWALLYYFVFRILLKKVSSDIDDFATYLVVGLFTIRYLSGTLSHAARSLDRSNNLITSLQFPRALIPVSSAVSDLLQFLPAVVVLFGVAMLAGEPLRWHVLLLVPSITLCAVFGVGIAFIAARLVSQVSDIGELIPFFNRALFYTSGVFFSLDRYGDGLVGTAMKHQPFAIYLELNRSALIEEVSVQGDTWFWGVFWAVSFCSVGFVYFWRAEARYGRG